MHTQRDTPTELGPHLITSVMTQTEVRKQNAKIHLSPVIGGVGRPVLWPI